MKTTRLQVTMRDVEPAVTRLIDVPATATLPELHQLLQAALGWTDSHLHQFFTAGACYGIPDDDAWPQDQRDEAEARLADLGAAFTYVYDFGDDWIHDVEVLGPGGPEPGCVDGAGSCPPEDCGGPGGYAELLEALADPAHSEHERLRDWVGNRLGPFDRDNTDQRVRRTVGAVPDSVRLLLGLLDGGVKLTPGGRLPRTVVRAMQEHRPHWHLLGRPAHIEEDLMPLAVLHDLLRQVGLARVRHGALAPTKAAADDLTVVRRLRTAFEPSDFGTRLIELAVGLLAAHGAMPVGQLATGVHPLLGHRWQLGGRPLTVEDVRRQLYSQSAMMSALDLVNTSGRGAWAAGPSARSLLPGIDVLAEYFTNE